MNKLVYKHLNICLDLPSDLHDWLQSRAENSGRTIEDEVTALLMTCCNKSQEDPVSAAVKVMHHLMDIRKRKAIRLTKKSEKKLAIKKEKTASKLMKK